MEASAHGYSGRCFPRYQRPARDDYRASDLAIAAHELVPESDFIGITSTDAITNVQFQAPAGDYLLLKDVSIGSYAPQAVTPEGSSLAMMGMGGLPVLLGLGTRFRRGRRQLLCVCPADMTGRTNAYGRQCSAGQEAGSSS